jgi:hypothetical protein
MGRVLLQNGADPDIENYKSSAAWSWKTSLQIALANNNEDFAALFDE